MNERDERIWHAVRSRLDAVSNDIVVPLAPRIQRAPPGTSRSPSMRARVPLSLATTALTLAIIVIGVGIIRQGGLGSSTSVGAGAPSSSASATPQPSATLVTVSPVLPTWPDPIENGACPQANMWHVTLRGDKTNSDRPAYVESLDGTQRTILWPYGFSARFNPDLEILNDRGEVVAWEGDLLDLTGGVVDPAFDFFACRVTKVE